MSGDPELDTTKFPCDSDYPNIRVTALCIGCTAGFTTVLISVVTFYQMIHDDDVPTQRDRPSRVLYYVHLLFFFLCGLWGILEPTALGIQCHPSMFDSWLINLSYWASATVCLYRSTYTVNPICVRFNVLRTDSMLTPPLDLQLSLDGNADDIIFEIETSV